MLQEKHSALKREHQKIKFRSFLPSWIRIQSGSGSTTMIFFMKNSSFGRTRIRIRIGSAPWIRIHTEAKSWVRSALKPMRIYDTAKKIIKIISSGDFMLLRIVFCAEWALLFSLIARSRGVL